MICYFGNENNSNNANNNNLRYIHANFLLLKSQLSTRVSKMIKCVKQGRRWAWAVPEFLWLTSSMDIGYADLTGEFSSWYQCVQESKRWIPWYAHHIFLCFNMTPTFPIGLISTISVNHVTCYMDTYNVQN